MNEEYKRYVRKHNDEVRSILKRNFEKDEWWPESTASLRFRKYNDYYWKSFGGKSFNNTSVCDSNHEWHEKYLLRSKRHMQYCVSQVLSSTVSDKASIIEDYAYTNFPVDNFFEAVCDMDIGEDDQKYVLRSILESCVDWELIALANASWISDNRIDFIVEWISETDTIEDEDKAFILKQIQ